MSTALPDAAKIHGGLISQAAFQATRKALLIAVVLGFGMGSARAQLNTEVADVTAANNAFYTALSALDAAAMEKVWAHESYVTNIAPPSKAVAIGSAAVQGSYRDGPIARNAQMSIKPVETQIHINGNVAWVVGGETYDTKLKDGTSVAGTNFVTNVFEKTDGRWLMVSHHAHRPPQ